MQPSDQMGLTMIHVVLYPEGLALLCGPCQKQVMAPMNDRRMVDLQDLIDRAQQHVRQAHDHSPVSPEQIERGGFNPYTQDDVDTYGAALVYAMGEDERCAAKPLSSERTCELVAGHEGDHFATLKYGSTLTWMGSVSEVRSAR